MAEHAARGKQLLDQGKYLDAAEEFTTALKSVPTSPSYLISRSTAYQRAKDYAASLTDAEVAVVNAQKRAKKELIVEAQQRRGVALYSLGRHGDAKFVLEIVQRMDDKNKQVTMYQNMNEKKLAELGADDEKAKVTVKETPVLESGDKQTVTQQSAEPAKAPASANSTTPTTQPAVIQQTPADKIRNDWYQNNENVYFTLLAKGVPKDKTQVDITERSMTISFPIVATESSYDFTLDPLFAPVKPDSCVTRILGTKVEIVLAKATPGQKWHALESAEPDDSTRNDSPTGDAEKDDLAKRAALAPTQQAGPAYPTSSKNGPKNWDKITKDLSKTEGAKPGSIEDDDDYEGGDEANHFFKKLFKDASPDVQRAMMKSYTESNGTALSTNWDEVGKAKVETTPPDGMEAKKWGA